MRSCQLMAGLMTEAIARAADKDWRQKLAAERAAMLEALERIKPQLERLAVEPGKNVAAQAHQVIEPAESVVEPIEIGEADLSIPVSTSSAKSGRETVCSQCGYQFGEQELFCGRCGTARPSATSSSGDLQSNWASMWRLQQETENKQHEEIETDGHETELGSPAMDEGRLAHELSLNLSPELKKSNRSIPRRIERTRGSGGGRFRARNRWRDSRGRGSCFRGNRSIHEVPVAVGVSNRDSRVAEIAAPEVALRNLAGEASRGRLCRSGGSAALDGAIGVGHASCGEPGAIEESYSAQSDSI